MKPFNMVTTVWCALCALGALPVCARHVYAQPPAAELLADTSLVRRTLAARVVALTGTPVRLDTLVQRALRDAFEVRRAEALLALRYGIEQEARSVFDPMTRLSSLAASAPSVVAATQQRLELGAGWTAPTGLQLDFGAVRADLGAQVGAATGARVGARPTTWSLAMSQPLLEGRGQPGVEPRAAAAERRASDAALERSRQVLATAVELAYWSLAEAQVVEAVFERSVEIARELVARYEALAARDLVPNLDLLTVRSGAAQRDALRINAQQARRDRSDELLLLVYGAQAGARLGSDTVPVKALDSDITAQRLDPLRELLPDAANRPDVREAFARREGAALRVGRARNALLPSLALTGVYTGTADMATASAQVGAPVSAMSSNSWQLGLSLGLPVFNRRDRGGREQASATLDLSTIDAQAREAEAVADIRTAWRAVELGTQRLHRSEQAAAFAWAQLVGERQRVELGLGDPFRLLQTEEVAVRAQLEATSARFALIRGNARLRLALGRTGADN